MALDLLWVLVGLVLTVGTGLFVASEFALVNLDRADLESRQAARRERPRADDQRAEDHLDPPVQRPARHHAHHAAHRLHDGAGDQPAARRPAHRAGAARGERRRRSARIVGVAIATLLSMMLGELVPKNFALALPLADRQGRDAVPGRRSPSVFRPRSLCSTARANARPPGHRHRAEGGALRRAHGRGARAPGPPLGAGRAARGGPRHPARAARLRVRRPRRGGRDDPARRHDQASRHDDPAEIVDPARSPATGYSRFPVIGEDSDDIVGIVHVKQAVALPRERAGRGAGGRAAVRAAARAARRWALDTLLGAAAPRRLPDGHRRRRVRRHRRRRHARGPRRGARRRGSRRARPHAAPGSSATGGAVIFPGVLRPDELLERTGIRVPEDDEYETVGGFVMSELERIPERRRRGRGRRRHAAGQRLDGRRVDRLRFTPTEADARRERARRDLDQCGATGRSRP